MRLKRRRVRVVLDTNVWVANFLTRRPDQSPNRRVVRRWLIVRGELSIFFLEK